MIPTADMNVVDESPKAELRIDYLDAARGLTIFLMIFVNFVAHYTAIPAWTKHASGDGFTYVDGIAPLFVFIMGISGAFSLSRRLRASGPGKAVLHALKRNGLHRYASALPWPSRHSYFSVPAWRTGYETARASWQQAS